LQGGFPSFSVIRLFFLPINSCEILQLTHQSVSYHLILRFVDQQWEQLIVKGIGQRLIILPFRLYSDNAAGQVDIRFRLLFVQERRALVGGGIVDQDVHLFSSKLVVRYSDAKASVIFMLV